MSKNFFDPFKNPPAPFFYFCCSSFHDFVEEKHQTRQITNKSNRKFFTLTLVAQPTLTCSKLTIETQGQGWKSKTRVTSSNPRVTSSNPRVRRLKARVARLKVRVGRLKARVGGLKARVRRLKARVEAIKPRLR